MYFCKDNSRLFKYEQLMQEPPGYRPRKSGLVVSQKDIVVDQIFQKGKEQEMILRMMAYDLPERLQRELPQSERKVFFINNKHKKLFTELLDSSRGKMMVRSSRYIAAVFLLSADEELWKMVETDVTDIGIFFDNIIIHGVNTKQYVLYHMAKEIYTGDKFISEDELADSDLISDEMYALILHAYFISVGGFEVLLRIWEDINE